MTTFLFRYSLAVQYLTIFSPGLNGKGSGLDLARSVPWFPVVGLLLGGGLSLLYFGLVWILPSDLADLTVIFVLIAVTRGRRLRGLVQWIQPATRSEFSSPAKDEGWHGSLGPTQVFVLLAVLLLKFVSLDLINESVKPQAILMMPLVSHWNMTFLVYAARFFKRDYLDPGSFIRWVEGRDFFRATVVFIAFPFYVLKLKALFVLFIMILFSLLYLKLCRARNLGFDEDALGASSEPCEILFLMALQGLNFASN
ncbi:MAG: hypothetical protein COV67_10785 [Nitrospinae bacterium CG11_big_fil_rev_8_21_14_0_20_56_8]|nr:MAG: hypothetical protein COV67_10785 [Nitrospinae bacterium CG11_big_fil_rev_8_21_14_0_20_56_8]